MPTIITAPGDLKYHRLDRDTAFIESCAGGGQFAEDTHSSAAVVSPAAWSGSDVEVSATAMGALLALGIGAAPSAAKAVEEAGLLP